MNRWFEQLHLPPEVLGAALLVGVAVMAIAAALLAVVRRQNERRRTLLRSRGNSGTGVSEQESSRLTSSVGSVGSKVASGHFSLQLQVQLTRAGFTSSAAPAVYIGAKIILLLIGFSLGVITAIAFGTGLGMGLFLSLFTGCALFFVPNLFVSSRRRGRSGELRRRLPDAVDLLEICVSSGMGLDMAWNAVAQEVRRVSTALADEMDLTRLEIGLGVPRTQAMRHMAERTGVEDISSLVALLVQSERFGASIVDALQTFATTMREIHSKRAEESAEKLAVKLLFPMVLFIFPTLLIVMVGPAVMRIVQVMG